MIFSLLFFIVFLLSTDDCLLKQGLLNINWMHRFNHFDTIVVFGLGRLNSTFIDLESSCEEFWRWLVFVIQMLRTNSKGHYLPQAKWINFAKKKVVGFENGCLPWKLKDCATVREGHFSSKTMLRSENDGLSSRIQNQHLSLTMVCQFKKYDLTRKCRFSLWKLWPKMAFLFLMTYHAYNLTAAQMNSKLGFSGLLDSVQPITLDQCHIIKNIQKGHKGIQIS